MKHALGQKQIAKGSSLPHNSVSSNLYQVNKDGLLNSCNNQFAGPQRPRSPLQELDEVAASQVTPEVQPADATIQATPRAVQPPRRMVPYVEVPVVRPHHHKHHNAPRTRAACVLSPPARAASQSTRIAGDRSSNSDFDGDELFAVGQEDDELSQADDVAIMEDEQEPTSVHVDGDSSESAIEFMVAPPGMYAHLTLLALPCQQLF